MACCLFWVNLKGPEPFSSFTAAPYTRATSLFSCILSVALHTRFFSRLSNTYIFFLLHSCIYTETLFCLLQVDENSSVFSKFEKTLGLKRDRTLHLLLGRAEVKVQQEKYNTKCLYSLQEFRVHLSIKHWEASFHANYPNERNQISVGDLLTHAPVLQ